MQKINIIGKEVNIAFNLATEIAYEQITGEAFGIEKLSFTKNAVALYMAAIIANNPDIDITTEDIISKASGAEVKALSDAIYAEMKAWMNIPDVMDEKVEAKYEDEEKNA
jgi:hypothetical protein